MGFNSLESEGAARGRARAVKGHNSRGSHVLTHIYIPPTIQFVLGKAYRGVIKYLTWAKML